MSSKFTIVKKGYNPEEVDKYIDGLEEVIKSYKDKDSAIKNAIVSAQLAADNIIKNAEMMSEDIKRRTSRQFDEITEGLSFVKNNLVEFESEYKSLFTKYLNNFDNEGIGKLQGRIVQMHEDLSNLNREEEE